MDIQKNNTKAEIRAWLLPGRAEAGCREGGSFSDGPKAVGGFGLLSRDDLQSIRKHG